MKPLGRNFSEILIKIQNFSFKKIHLKISSAKWRPFCPGEMSSFTQLLQYLYDYIIGVYWNFASNMTSEPIQVRCVSIIRRHDLFKNVVKMKIIIHDNPIERE